MSNAERECMMANTEEYVCPKHNDIVLFTDNTAIELKMFMPEKPAHCPKCDRYYYKSECRIKK